MEEFMSDEIKLESLVNSNDSIKNDDIFSSKDNIKKLYDDFQNYITENKNVYLDDSSEDFEFKTIKNEKDFEFLMGEFRISSREAIIANKNRMLFVIRQEELYKTISDLQRKLDEYDNFVKEHGEAAASDEYTNTQLNDIHLTRTQSIPMYLVELETLSSAIKDNEDNYMNNMRSSYDLAIILSRYLFENINNYGK